MFMQDMEVVIPDSSKLYSSSGMVESKSVGTFSPFQRQDSHRGLFVDRGVGSPRLVKSSSTSTFSTEPRLDKEKKVCVEVHLACEDDQELNYLLSAVVVFLKLCPSMHIVRIQCQKLLELLQLQP